MARSAATPRVRFQVGSLLVVAAAVAACAGGASRLPSRGLRQAEPDRAALARDEDSRRGRAPEAGPETSAPSASPAVARSPERLEGAPPSASPAEPRGEAVLQQVLQLRERELLPQALALVDAELATGPTVAWRSLRAELLRDLGRRGEARAEWNKLRREAGAADLPPEQLIELAELEWMEGDATAAAATLQAAQDRAAGSDLEAVRERARSVADELAKSPRPRPLAVRDVLGQLRSAESPRDRLAMLEAVMRAEDLDAEARRRALAIASSDEAASVRARAVQLVVPQPEDAAEFVLAALADRDGLVRRCAVARAEQLLGPAAAPLLVEQLQREDDESTFTVIDATLCRLVRGRDAEPFAGADAESRRRVAAAWRQHLEVRR